MRIPRVVIIGSPRGNVEEGGMYLAAAALLWTVLDTGTKASLRGLSAVSGEIAWAGGTAGTIVRTVDGGRTWQKVSPAESEKLDFRDIEAFDAMTAWALSAGPGGASRLYFTGDGGGTWRMMAANQKAEGFWDAMAFWDRRSGVVLGDPIGGRFEVRITRDGGVTWSEPVRLPAARAGEAAFAASGTCLIAAGRGRAWFVTGGTGGGRLFQTSDWGKTWSVTELPVAHGAQSAGAFSVAFEGKRGIVAGGDFQKPGEGGAHVAFTADGGRTWRLAAGSTRYLSAVKWVRGKAVAAGPGGSEVSRDRGASWQLGAENGFHALSVGRGGWIWASGADGRAARARVD